MRQVRSFLDHIGCYRISIKDFSKVTCPFTNLLTKGALFVLDEPCVKVFENLQFLLVLAPIMQPPNFSPPFEIMCNASNFAIRIFLGQTMNRVSHVIYYASRTLTDAQKNYSTTEKELLAIVFAVEKFRPFLLCSKSDCVY